ncbi:hypothetical protein FKM82_001015 [Ascaphus truei]
MSPAKPTHCTERENKETERDWGRAGKRAALSLSVRLLSWRTKWTLHQGLLSILGAQTFCTGGQGIPH